LKILWQSVAPWYPTGYGNITAIVCKILQELGHEVKISAYYGLRDGGFLKWRGIPVHPAEKDWGAPMTKRYFDKFESDICITNQDIWTLPDGYGSNFAWHPYFPVDHTPIPPAVLGALRWARKPIVYSKHAVGELWKQSLDCYYVPVAFDTDVYRPDKEHIFKLGKPGDFIIGSVGNNMGPRKNLAGALQAFATFHKRHPDSFMYCHTNPDGYRLGDIDLVRLGNDLGIQDFIMYPDRAEYDEGFFTDDWMRQMYNTFDVFLHPSKGEGFGMPIIEAQACGIPVIITDGTAMTELFGAGWLLTDTKPEWTYQSSWQFEPSQECILNALEEAYEMKQKGTLGTLADPARQKALEYSRPIVKQMWKDALDDIEKHLHDPLNLEGVQGSRLNLIPKSCEPQKVLDLGSGVTKPYKQHLKHLGEYVAVDIKGGKGIIEADARELPFKDKEFGFVWCSEVIEHSLEPEKIVDEAKRVGVHGVILFPTPLNPNFSMDPEHTEVKINCPIDANGNGMIIW
jgi:glycosyltransferase involved in cell wall biosynthesis